MEYSLPMVANTLFLMRGIIRLFSSLRSENDLFYSANNRTCTILKNYI